jgi:hypothetical protein
LIGVELVGKYAIKEALKISVDTYRNKRFENIIIALSEGEIKISKALLSSDNFISCFLKTNEAIDKATSNEKINALTNIFLSGLRSNLISTLPDLFHEAMSIFSELSYREIIILDIVKKHLPFTVGKGGAGVADKNNDAIEEICGDLGIQKDLAYVLMSRLQRTGFIIDSAMLGDRRYFIKTELLNNIYGYLDFKINSTQGSRMGIP